VRFCGEVLGWWLAEFKLAAKCGWLAEFRLAGDAVQVRIWKQLRSRLLTLELLVRQGPLVPVVVWTSANQVN
jgi:hypothetical protein